MKRVINLTTNLHSRGELLLSFPTLIINSNLGGAGKKTERGGGGGGGGGLRWPIMPPPPPSPSSFNATATRTWNPLTERARAPSEVVRTKKRGHFLAPKSVGTSLNMSPILPSSIMEKSSRSLKSWSCQVVLTETSNGCENPAVTRIMQLSAQIQGRDVDG